MNLGVFSMSEKDTKKITRNQSEVLDYIKKYIAEHTFPPAVREIGSALGLSSPATVQAHLNGLKNAGVIKNSSNKFRTIELLVDNEYLEKDQDVVKVPLLGKITA